MIKIIIATLNFKQSMVGLIFFNSMWIKLYKKDDRINLFSNLYYIGLSSEWNDQEAVNKLNVICSSVCGDNTLH